MIILSPATQINLQNLINKPSHAVLLAGPEGSGKLYTAKYLASKIINIDSNKMDLYPYFKLIAAENGTILIEHIRELQKFLQLKTTGSGKIRRVAIIQDAHLMNVESQNALLKSLEEPPSDTIIILTTQNNLSLKETIYSRVVQIPIVTPSKAQLKNMVESNLSEQEADKYYTLSGGLPGLYFSLINQEASALMDSIQLAKNTLASTTYDRLLMVDNLSKHKDDIPHFLQALKIIASTALEQSAAKNNHHLTTKWYKILRTIYFTESYLPSNPNSKLLLNNLFLSL